MVHSLNSITMIESHYFDIEELVCRHVHDKYGDASWQFLDPRLIITINTIRDRIGKSITVNNWKDGGDFDERGLRCPQCSIVKDNLSKGNLYMSAHTLGKAVDFNVQGLLGEEIRLWIAKYKNWLPYPIRLEKGVSWVHLDLFNLTSEKIVFFNP
jgi:hypothetical protein